MMKFSLLAGAMLVTTPAIAQQVPANTQVPPSSAAPATGQMAPQSTPMTSDQSMANPSNTTNSPMTDQSTMTSPSTPTSSAMEPQPVTGQDQITRVVDAEFSTYDKDANGTLNMGEFGTWMVALRTATDKSVVAGSKSMQAWTKGAFAQADTDKSKSITKTELTGFLAQPQG